MPAIPTRITSLAPNTRPDDLVPAIVKRGNAALAVAACLRKLRRVMFFMRFWEGFFHFRKISAENKQDFGIAQARQGFENDRLELKRLQVSSIYSRPAASLISTSIYAGRVNPER